MLPRVEDSVLGIEVVMAGAARFEAPPDDRVVLVIDVGETAQLGAVVDSTVGTAEEDDAVSVVGETGDAEVSVGGVTEDTVLLMVETLPSV